MVTGLADDLGEVTVVQIDAHADLADELGGRRWSHGTVMRRLWERGCRLVQIGIRSLSRAEYELIGRGERITTYYAHQLAEQWDEILAALRGLTGKVYLTIDVDGLDPAVFPSTGTPQPGGLSWRQTMEVLRARGGRIAVPADRGGRGGIGALAASARLRPSAARLAAKVLAWRRWARAEDVEDREHLGGNADYSSPGCKWHTVNYPG